MNERMTKRDTDGQAMMDCEKCKADWTGKHGKPMADCTALYCRNRLLDRLVEHEDTGWTPEMLHKLGENAWHLWDFAQAAENMTVGRLKELAEADEDGRCVVLPCKGTDKLYVVGTKQIVECIVAEMYLMDDETIEYLVNFECVDNCDGCPFNSWERETVSDEYHCGGEYGDGSVSSKDFGKTVFLTREEAEKALQEMEGKG